ncbi:hypothetical protein [Paenibacillus sp. FSL P2-0173]|uniref:hypothetical protein n=1 Tax=Paenibacillus sp. FSL P2-0173 TaxID=2921627 RepID=UPI0030FB7C82
MKINLENEVTYITSDFSLNTQQLLEDLHKQIEDNRLTVFRYNDCIQMLFEDRKHDKKKITFKVNHGDLYYSIATKDRLTSTNDILQTYQENKTVWAPIDELDLSIFQNKVLALYYKELNRMTIKYKDVKYKVNGHDVQFLDSNCEVKKRMKYIEVESKKFEHDHINFFTDYFMKRELNMIDYENSKWIIGKEIIGTKNQFTFFNISELKQFLLDLYTKMSVCYLV